MNVNVATNSAKITQLNGTDTMIDLGNYAHRVGYAPFDWFTLPRGQRDQGSGANQAAYNRRRTRGRFRSRASTAPRRAAARPRATTPPARSSRRRCTSATRSPTFEGSWSNTIRFQQLPSLRHARLRASGFKRLDNNIRIRCQLFHTCLEYVQPAEHRSPAARPVFSNGTLRDFIINDAKYVKLREVSLSYDAPNVISSRAGANGDEPSSSPARNLHTWTPYTGLDPGEPVRRWQLGPGRPGGAAAAAQLRPSPST